MTDDELFLSRDVEEIEPMGVFGHVYGQTSWGVHRTRGATDADVKHRDARRG